MQKPGPKSVVRINHLKAVEGRIKDGQAALDDCTVSEHVNIAGMNSVALELALTEGTTLGAGAVTWHTLTVLCLKL